MNDAAIRELMYMSAMVGCGQALPADGRAELEAWENRYLNGSGAIATSDWPGWEKYIGPKPAASTEAPDRRGFVYVIGCGCSLYKIGRSKNMELRLRALQAGNPRKLVIEHVFQSEDAVADEERLHYLFARKRKRNEWFALDTNDLSFLRSVQYSDAIHAISTPDSSDFDETDEGL